MLIDNINEMDSTTVDFYSKGEEKCQVVVQHLKLPSEEVCEEMEVYWKESLIRLIRN